MTPSLPASSSFAVTGGKIFDGAQFHGDKALIIDDGRIVAIAPIGEVPSSYPCIDASGALVVPGFVDLQVNGGGGVLLNNQPDLDGIRRICSAHARFGTTALLPTLITDKPELRDDVIALGREAFAAKVPGYLGLHLEGPHLSLARKGTHDPSLIRPMQNDDLASLVASAGTFGRALITVAPESVTAQQVKALVRAGYHVSLGHTDAGCNTVGTYIDAGATLVTHLFNAMSQMGNREPGLVGAALTSGALHCGLIADGIHVDPVSIQIALRAKRGPGKIFLVTDAMSSIGTDETGFILNGRQVYRRDGRLTLADGTLAGADIDMLACVRFMRDKIGVAREEALNMASLYPAEAIGAGTKGRLAPGADADFLLLTPTLDLLSTWIGGTCVHRASEIRQGVQA